MEEYGGQSYARTQWNGGKRRFEVVFNEVVVDMLTDEQIDFIWKHELGHIALGHFREEHCGSFNGMDSVVAADMDVNWFYRDHPAIDELQVLNPRQWLDDLNMKHSEYPYEVLHSAVHAYFEENQPPPNEGGGSGDGDGDGEGGSGGGGDPEDTDKHGGHCDGIHNAEEAAKDGLAQAAQIIASTAIGIHGGSMSITLPRDDPRPEWANQVSLFAQAFVESDLADKRTHSQPNQTLRQAGIHVPSVKPRWAQKPKVLCFLVDTSGSMMHDLRHVVPVLQFMDQEGIKVHLIAGDTRVTFDEEVKGGMLPELKGGGGTEITPLFDRAMEYKPDAVLCFTDGYVPGWPNEEKGVTYGWVCREQPPFGKWIKYT